MIAHIIHYRSGKIISVVFQGTEIEGELQIQPQSEGELVTTVDLREVFPERAVDTRASSEGPRQDLYLLARDIRDGFLIDVQHNKLERLK